MQKDTRDRFCSNCGTELTEETIFCPNCGKKIEQKMEIPNCGKKIEQKTEIPRRNKRKISKKWIIIGVIGLIVIGSMGEEDNTKKSTETSTEASTENVKEVETMISVQRTGNILTNIGALEVWIDNENVFEVEGDSTNGVTIMMTVGEHTIQTKGQGDKSKKLKFIVSEESDNEFYFSAEISNWYGIKLKERKYVVEN